MNHLAEQTPADRPLPRLALVIGLGLLAISAIVVNSRAETVPAAAAAALPAVGYTSPWSDGIDWDRVAAANITPGETVGAYDR